MKNEEDEAFDELAKKQGNWGGGFQAKRKAAADKVQEPAQEPVAWMSSDKAWMWSDYSKALAAVANIPTLTLIPLYTTPPQPAQERNFCPRCGKRTADLTAIHTCTPPQENSND